jgi:hypothetical protein
MWRQLCKEHCTMLSLIVSLALLVVTTQAHVQDGLLEDLLEDMERNQQFPEYQYSDSMYDVGPDLAAAGDSRALHEEDARQQSKQGRQLKSSMLPAYCDPPNPCPAGYTSQDGCIEQFENKADFSQKYQASQNCMCDTEHMFSCSDEMMKQEDTGLSFLGLPGVDAIENPFLNGPKLPIAAKKGFGY